MGKNKKKKGLMALNKEQEEAANSVLGIAAVIAVPGSGKTLTMTRRIGNLVQLHNMPPEKILGLTFTRNAAEAMRNRLIPVLEDLASRVTLTTIHSFCHFLLRSEGQAFEILSGKNQIIFMREVMKRLKIKDLSVGMVLREISLAKNNLITGARNSWRFMPAIEPCSQWRKSIRPTMRKNPANCSWILMICWWRHIGF